MEEADRKENVSAWDFAVTYIYDTNRKAENDLVVRHSEYSESSLGSMGMDQLLVSTVCTHVKDDETHFSMQFGLI